MGGFLNVGVIQMPVSRDTAVNLQYLEEKLAALMGTLHRPELVVGVECIASFTPEHIPGPMTEYFGRLAKRYGIYLIPGTLCERDGRLPEGRFYNAAPIFNPRGELVDVYRKMCPWRPTEEQVEPGKRYVAFDIPEKGTRVGVLICYDMNFPEIARAETLLGAEVLVKLTMDPQELYQVNRHIHYARAVENQAYLVSTNGVGFFGGSHLYGHSQIIDPQGQLLWEAGQTESAATVTLDLDLVRRCRRYGTLFLDHYLQHLRDFQLPPVPYAEDYSRAPVYRDLPAAPENAAEYEESMREAGAGQLGRMVEDAPDLELLERNLRAFLLKR